MADDTSHPADAGVQDILPSPWEQLRDRFATDDELREDESPIITALQAAGIEIKDRLAHTIDAAVWAERRAVEALMLEAHYKSRKQRYEERAAQLREQIRQLMTDLDITKFHTQHAHAALQRGPISLVVADEAVIPDEYFRVTRVLQRQELKDDIQKHGVVVEGAYLSNGAPMLVVRRK